MRTTSMNPLQRFNRTLMATTMAVVAGWLAPAAQAQVGFSLSFGQQQQQDAAQADPPSRVARVSILSGNVSIEPASIEQFNVAEPNYPMTTGDRIYADQGSNAEIQTGQLAVRLGQQTDLTVTAMTDLLAQFGLAQGSVHLRSYNIYQGEAVEIDTPNVAVTVLQAGDVRVDVDPTSDVTVVRVQSGQVQVNGNGVEEVLEPGERLSLSGSNPVYAQALGGTRPDGLDRFSSQRDAVYLNAFAADAQYLNPGTIGAEDLTAYGDWSDDAQYGGGAYGAVWFPRGVDAGWQPYRNGHWTWVAPWGWTWIEAEPWGFAPFHYGRWNRFGDRWGWIPGPPVVRPVYSPALVAFVGGGGFAGGDVTAWFPLGPGEAYHPWYHASPVYVNRVNVSNLYDRNVMNVRNIYNQRTVVNEYSSVNNNYANRNSATVAMRQDNFAGGRRADQSDVHIDPRQMQGAAILPHPLVTPQRGMVATAPAHAVPAMQQRPVLASHEDTAVRPVNGVPRWQGGQQPQPSQPPQRTQQPAQTQPQPVQTQRQPVQTQPSSPAYTQQNQGLGPRRMPTPIVQAPVQETPAVTPAQPQRTQPQTPAPQQRAPQPVAQVPVQQAPVQSVPVPQQAQRPLFNKAVPPEPRPSFDAQRQAIQQSDPGRPLGPQQLNNLKQSQPAGQPQQAEPAHPQEQPMRGGPMKAPGQPK